MLNKKVPDVIFKTRIRDGSVGGDNPFRWEERSSGSYFSNKRVVLFSLPGAFTPTCSTLQLPDYDKLYPDFKKNGMDGIYCMAVNDAFVMNAWGAAQNADNIMMLADGSGSYSEALGLTMDTAAFGGVRSQRYAMVIDNGVVSHLYVEKGNEFEVSKAEFILSHL